MHERTDESGGMQEAQERQPGRVVALVHGVLFVLGVFVMLAVGSGAAVAAGLIADAGDLQRGTTGAQLAVLLAESMVVVYAVVWWRLSRRLRHIPMWRAGAARSLRAASPIVALQLIAIAASGELHAPAPERIGLFAVVAAVVGIAEELSFRGVLPLLLGGERRPWLAIWGSAVLFGLLHVGDSVALAANAVAVTLAVGVPFAAIRLAYRGVAGLAAAHGLVDLGGFLALGALVPSKTTVGAAAAQTITAVAVAVAYCVWYARQRRE